jgi:IPT/TIG domain
MSNNDERRNTINNDEQRRREQYQREVQEVNRGGPKSINEPATQQAPPHHLPSINEPPGSDVTAPPAGEGGGEVAVPELLSIDPEVAAIGDDDLTLTCTGEDFDDTCVITFNGGEEPTTFVSATELTTTVKPSTATVAGEFPVTVKNAHGESEPVMFEFVEPARAAHVKSRPKAPPKQSKKKGSRR